MLGDLPSVEVDLIEVILFVVEFALQDLSFLGGIRTKNNLHILIEKGHRVRTDCIVMDALYFLELVSQILIVEDNALSVADNPESSTLVDVDLHLMSG